MSAEKLIQQLKEIQDEKNQKGSIYKPFSWWSEKPSVKIKKSVYSWQDKQFLQTAHDFSNAIALLNGLIEDSLAADQSLDKQRILSDSDISTALLASIRMAEYISNEISALFGKENESEQEQQEK